MKTASHKWLAGLLGLALLATLAACSVSPPKGLEEAANALSTGIEDAREANSNARDDYADLLKKDEYSFMQEYSPEQQHADRFDQADDKLDEAQQEYDDSVKPILDDYEEAKEDDLEAAIESVTELVEEAKVLTAEPPQWADKVVATKADPEGTVATAATTLEDLDAAYPPLEADVAAAKETYSDNATAIDEKFQPFVDWHSGAIEANEQLATEAEKSSPNYAVMTEQATTVANNADTFHKKAPEFEQELADLDVRITHTLRDIQVVSEIYIWRTTWNSSGYDEHDHEYPPVEFSDQKVVEYFAQFGPDDVLASDAEGWGRGGFETDKADREHWDMLGIDPRDPKWEDDDNTAEFYLSWINDRVCEQWYELREGQPATQDRPNPEDSFCSQFDTEQDLAEGKYWVEVDEFDPEPLGMDIFSKEVGQFRDQASTAATPHGMLYVGDESFGEWVGEGDSAYWVFGAAAAGFIVGSLIGDATNPHHYRNEYNAWNDGYRYQNKPYFGKRHGEEPYYGGYAPLASSRFSNSYYWSSGAYDINRTVRAAGPSSRGGGPGGGGK